MHAIYIHYIVNTVHHHMRIYCIYVDKVRRTYISILGNKSYILQHILKKKTSIWDLLYSLYWFMWVYSMYSMQMTFYLISIIIIIMITENNKLNIVIILLLKIYIKTRFEEKKCIDQINIYLHLLKTLCFSITAT